MRIKIFEVQTTAPEKFTELEAEVNQWLEENDNLDVVSIQVVGQPTALSITVLYSQKS